MILSFLIIRTNQARATKMPKSNKPKLIIVNADGVCCEKCSKVVPEIYYLGQNFKEDELWIECIHNGWYCPDHSPTSNCGDDDCGCCNAGYEEDQDWFISFEEDESIYYETKEEMKKMFDLFVKDMREFGCITIDAPMKRPTHFECYGDDEAEDWMWAEDEEDEKEDPHYSDKVCAERKKRGACESEDCWCILWEEENGEAPVLSKSEVEFDSNAMDNALYKDNLDWSFYKPEEGEYSVVYITNRK